MSNYQVIVGNIGTVYDDDHYFEACKTYGEYKRMSESGVGRAGNEQVTLMAHGEPYFEHEPPEVVDVSQIVTGTGSGPANGGKNMPMYRHATYGEWSIKYWPIEGGSEAFVNIPDIGWCLDVADDMPHEVWVALLHAVDAPIC